MARGGTAAVHVLVDSLAPRRDVRFTVAENGRTVREARWFRLVDVPVEENTGRLGFTVGSMGKENARNPSARMASR